MFKQTAHNLFALNLACMPNPVGGHIGLILFTLAEARFGKARSKGSANIN
jgi:hypothetical protein